MRIKTIYLLFFIILSVKVLAQAPFNNYYSAGAGNISYANQIEVFNYDTTYLVYAPWSDPSTQQGLRLLKLNKNGLTLIDKKFMFYNLTFATYLNNRLSLKTSQFSSLVIGDTYFGADRGLIFAKINNKLADTIHTRYYCDNTYAYGLGNRFRKDKKQIWYVGNKFNPNDNNYIQRPVFFKVDTSGNYLSQFNITTLSNYGPTAVFYDTIAYRVYIAGTNFNAPATPQSFVACIDTLGNVIWNKQLGSHPYKYSIQYITKVNGELILCGNYVTDVFNSLYSLEIIKRNALNGDSIWHRPYGPPRYHTLKSFVVNDDGAIVCAGSYNDEIFGARTDAVIFKVNGAGDNLWYKTYGIYGTSVYEIFYDIKKTPDGGYIMCGAPEPQPNCHSWVVKTDSLGVAPGMIIVGENDQKIYDKNFKIYPNPVNDYLNIEGFNVNELSEIKITDITGRVLIHEIVSEEKCQIQFKNLKPGLYLIIINSKNQNQVLKIMKE